MIATHTGSNSCRTDRIAHLPTTFRFGISDLFRLLSIVLFTGLISVPSPAEPASDNVLQLYGRGSLDATLRHFLVKRLKQVDSKRTNHILINLNSSSGRIDYAFDVVEEIEDQDARVSVYVTGDLKGPAILLCLAADHVFLHPDAQIQPGSLAYEGAGGALFHSGSIQQLTEQLAGIAERNGHPGAIARGIADPGYTIEQVDTNGHTRFVTGGTRDRLRQAQTVRVRQTISAPGTPITLSSAEAKRVGISTGTVSTLPELLGTLNERGEIQSLNVQLKTERPGYEYRLLWFTTNPLPVAIFLILGTAAALIELRRPGTGWSGAVATAVFAVPVYSFAFLDLAQTPALVLLLSGLFLLTFDSLVIPGEHISGFVSFVPVLSAFVLAPQLFPYSNLTGTPWQLYYLFNGFSTVLVSFGLGIVLFGMILTLLPGWFRSATIVPIGFRSRPEKEVRDDGEQQHGSGTVLTPLRPIGIVAVEDHEIVVCAHNRYIEPGATFDVKNVKSDGIRIRLR